MKSLSEYLSLPYRMKIIPDPEGGFVISYPDLPGCFTFGETLEEAVANGKDAKNEWIEAAFVSGIPIKEPDSI